MFTKYKKFSSLLTSQNNITADIFYHMFIMFSPCENICENINGIRSIGPLKNVQSSSNFIGRRRATRRLYLTKFALSHTLHLRKAFVSSEVSIAG